MRYWSCIGIFIRPTSLLLVYLSHGSSKHSYANHWLISVIIKSSPYSITERRIPELIPVLGSQPAGDVSHKPGGRLPLLSARPAVTPATLKRVATNFYCLVNRWGTTGVKSLPKTVTGQRRDCDLNPGPSAPESSTLTTRIPSHPRYTGSAKTEGHILKTTILSNLSRFKKIHWNIAG